MFRRIFLANNYVSVDIFDKVMDPWKVPTVLAESTAMPNLSLVLQALWKVLQAWCSELISKEKLKLYVKQLIAEHKSDCIGWGLKLFLTTEKEIFQELNQTLESLNDLRIQLNE